HLKHTHRYRQRRQDGAGLDQQRAGLDATNRCARRQRGRAVDLEHN
ncbi:MAG: hypothetical protein RLZZ105_924, partial [Actinomycetota bacterium]